MKCETTIILNEAQVELILACLTQEAENLSHHLETNPHMQGSYNDTHELINLFTKESKGF